jgi:hypothetical protein
MLKKELIKLAKKEENKKSIDYSQSPRKTRLGYSLGAGAAAHGFLLPGVMASTVIPLVDAFGPLPDQLPYPKLIKKLENNLTRDEAVELHDLLYYKHRTKKPLSKFEESKYHKLMNKAQLTPEENKTLERFYHKPVLRNLLSHAGVIGSSLLPIVSSPNSIISKLSPIIGAAASLPVSLTLHHKFPKIVSIPGAILYTGTAAGVPALTRAIKKHLYETRLRAEKK